MSDPINEIFNGTPDGIDEDELLEMNQADAMRQAEIKAASQMQEEEQQQGAAKATPTPKPEVKQTTPQAQGDAKPKSDKPGGGMPGYEQAFGGKNLVDMSQQEMQEQFGSTAVGQTFTGLVDFGVDLINFVTGGAAGLDKPGKYENEVSQAGREIMSVLAPTVLTAGAAALIGAAAKASKVKLLADPAINAIGKFAWGAGSGAAVDLVSSTSEDDNLTGTLKQNFPRTWGWIPDDIATLESDSPDVKRMKNVNEGLGFGIAVDIIGNAGKLFKLLNGVESATKYIPESEKGAAIFRNAKPSVDIADSAARRSDALDEVGQFNLSKVQQRPEPMTGEEYYINNNVSRTTDVDPEEARRIYQESWDNMDPELKAQYDELASQNTVPDIQTPIFGVHDMYGYTESGIRSVDDMGVLGARVDIARIAKNVDTIDGRVGSMLSEGAMKFALDGGAEYSQIMKGLGDQITAAGRYGYMTSTGTKIGADAVDKAMDDFAGVLGGIRRAEMDKVIKKMPKRELKGAIKETYEQLMDYDQQQANLLLQASLSGQISDMAQGLRLTDGMGSVDRGLDQILDRMELLMVADADTKLNVGMFKRFKNSLLNADGIEIEGARKAEMLKRAKREAKQAVDTLREVKAVRPDLLKPLMLAYDASNGNVKTVTALNDYMRQSTGVLKKAVIDGNPEVPSMVMRGFWGTVYNNTLLAFGTPLRAVFSNTALLIERQITPFAGALANGDGYTMKRALYQLSSINTALGNGLEYMAQTFKRSGLDPDYTGVAGRESLVVRNQKQIDVANAFADAAEAQGDDGPAAMMQYIDALNDLEGHPWMRFGNRAMQAYDGFTQAFVGTQEAFGRAFDSLAQGKITADALKATHKKVYDDMFKPDLMGRPVMTDDAVKAAAGELSLNLDNASTEAISEMIRKVPGLRPLLLFTRTPVNALKFAASHNPLGLFIEQVNEFGRPFAEVPLEKLEKILGARGIPLDDNAEIAYNAIRAELKGRKAIGTVATMVGVGLFLNDALTGDGIGDRQKMAARRKNGWKPRMITLPNGMRFSYDGIPGISDWIAMTANIMDNMDVLRSNDIAELLNASSFVIGASFTDKTGLTNVEPLFDILRGNPEAINKWATGFLPSAIIPGASQLNEISKLMTPNLKVVGDNIAQRIANRTPLKATMPDEFDYIDGGKVGEPMNAFTRIFNVYSPIKVSDRISDEKQFLIDVEFDTNPNFATDGKGVELSPAQQSRVASLMGKQKIFKQELTRIMNTTEGKKFREEFKDAQSRGANVSLDTFQNLHIEIDSAFNAAKEFAIATLDAESGGALSQRRYEQDSTDYFSKQGDVEAILSIPK